jgi:hypothetical protein
MIAPADLATPVVVAIHVVVVVVAHEKRFQSVQQLHKPSDCKMNVSVNEMSHLSLQVLYRTYILCSTEISALWEYCLPQLLMILHRKHTLTVSTLSSSVADP